MVGSVIDPENNKIFLSKGGFSDSPFGLSKSCGMSYLSGLREVDRQLGYLSLERLLLEQIYLRGSIRQTGTEQGYSAVSCSDLG